MTFQWEAGIKKYKKMLKNETDPRIKRWSISSHYDDPLYATSKHEAWHQIDFQLRTDGKFCTDRFKGFLKSNGVTRQEWYEVSEYAGSDIFELWAETGTALDLGYKIPANIKRAFIETIEDAGHTYP